MPAPTRFEPAQKRVRVMLGGEFIADTTRPLLVWDLPFFPWYYISMDDVEPGTLVEAGETDGTITYTVRSGESERVAAAHRYAGSADLGNHVSFKFRAMDGWFEEDEEIFAHPRDPHHRVDVLRSSRHVQIEVDGITVADTHSPVLLFETTLPTRFYLPKTDVRMDLLTPNNDSTQCPYKGTARYWNLDIGTTTYPSFVWSYPFPTAESAKIAGLVCFYNEKVDLFVDEMPLERPVSPFTSGRP